MFEHGDAVEVDGAEVWFELTTDHVYDCRFACAVTAQESEGLVGCDVERNVFYCEELAEKFADLGDLQDLLIS